MTIVGVSYFTKYMANIVYHVTPRTITWTPHACHITSVLNFWECSTSRKSLPTCLSHYKYDYHITALGLSYVAMGKDNVPSLLLNFRCGDSKFFFFKAQLWHSLVWLCDLKSCLITARLIPRPILFWELGLVGHAWFD